MNNNTENTTQDDGIELCEDCGVWSCDCYCDELVDFYRDIARQIY